MTTCPACRGPVDGAAMHVQPEQPTVRTAVPCGCVLTVEQFEDVAAAVMGEHPDDLERVY